MNEVDELRERLRRKELELNRVVCALARMMDMALPKVTEQCYEHRRVVNRFLRKHEEHSDGVVQRECVLEAMKGGGWESLESIEALYIVHEASQDHPEMNVRSILDRLVDDGIVESKEGYSYTGEKCNIYRLVPA